MGTSTVVDNRGGPGLSTSPLASGRLGKFNIVAGLKICGEVAAAGTTGSGNAIQCLRALRGHYDAINIVFMNNHNAAYDVVMGLFAPENGDPVHATNAPAALVGTRTVTVTAGAGGATSAAVFTATESGWIPLSSKDRTDDATKPPLVGFRYYIAGATTITRHNGVVADWLAFNTTYADDFIAYNRSCAGTDAVTTPGNLTTANTTDPGPATIPFIILARMRGGAITVAGIGDSTMSGIQNTATGRWNNWLHRACSAVTGSSLPVVPLSQGISGQNSANYLANGKMILTTAKPDIAVYTVATVNDGAVTQAVIDTEFAQMLDFVDSARQIGCIPIVMTKWPGTGAGALAAALNAKIRALNNIHVLDVDALCGEGAVDARTWVAGYTADNTHPNGVAEAVVATDLARIITGIIRANLL